MNILLGLICVASVAFLLRFLVALRVERRRPLERSVTVYTTVHPTLKRTQTPSEANKVTVMTPRSGANQSVRGRAMRIVVAVLAFGLCSFTLHAQQTTDQSNAASAEEVRELRQLVQQLQAKVATLEDEMQKHPPASSPDSAPKTSQPADQPAGVAALTADDRGVLDFFRGTTINLGLDGYYGYNFNQPVGRVNLLRTYDVMSNSFNLSQANLVLERAPAPENGQRFGIRVDLQYGQATETVQGSAANELRPQAYRNIFQAYGTYVVPVGSGLTVDFGKWASALGIEGNYTKDQINYSRSYYFDFLPFYHTGIRATYNFTPKFAVSYWLVNGAQQTEDFNGFKSQNFEVVVKPSKTLTWTSNYYFGQEGRDVVPVLNPGIPTRPTQPGLPEVEVNPAPNGRLHIVDNYVSWNATGKLTLAGEFDYVINRAFSESAPAHVTGGAGYARYQVTPKAAVAARAEYLSDRGGLFSGQTEALKETTLTYEYRFAEGFLARMEWRRDFSNQPFFLTDTQGVLSKHQNTATIGLVWWLGRKQGAW
jgi:hypothetical protein